ncbi:MAG: sulfotransferase [Vicinamibacterales bacterium]
MTPDVRPSAGCAPTFLIVGAPKAGTTSLYEWCRQHPAVGMSPIKEPSFFAPEVADFTPRAREVFDADAAGLRRWLDGARTVPRRHGLVLDWADYLSLFRDHADKAARGEASASYLASHGAPGAVRDRLPDARIVMVLRDPVDRLHSQFTTGLNTGDATGPFGAWARAQVAAEAARRPPFGPVWSGRYARHVARWRAAAPAGRIRIYLFEDLAADPAATMADLFTFIGVDAGTAVDVSQPRNVTTLPRWPRLARAVRPVTSRVLPVLPEPARRTARRWLRLPARRVAPPTAEERAALVAVYRDDVLALESLLDRPLDRWLR